MHLSPKCILQLTGQSGLEEPKFVIPWRWSNPVPRARENWWELSWPLRMVIFIWAEYHWRILKDLWIWKNSGRNRISEKNDYWSQYMNCGKVKAESGDIQTQKMGLFLLWLEWFKVHKAQLKEQDDVWVTPEEAGTDPDVARKDLNPAMYTFPSTLEKLLPS